MARLFRPVMRMMSASPEATASSTTYWMVGLSTSGSISLGCALVAGRKRVPSPAAGNTALRTLIGLVAMSLSREGSSPAASGAGLVRSKVHDSLGGRHRDAFEVEGLLDAAPQLHLGVRAL